MQSTQFIAVVEVATQPGDVQVGSAAALAEYQPVLGRSARGWVEVRLTITASGLAHACTTAAAMARVATGAEAIACQVMTQEEYDARRYAQNGRHAQYSDPVLPRQRPGTRAPEGSRI